MRRLDLHFIEASPGVSIEAIDRFCPLLEQLTIHDSLLTWTQDPYNENTLHGKKTSVTPWYCKRHQDRPCSTKDHFRKLKTCKLYRVDYKQTEDWEIFLRFASNLTSLHLESSRHMTDTSFHLVLSDQGLSNLEVNYIYPKIIISKSKNNRFFFHI